MILLISGGSGQLASEVARQSQYETLLLPRDRLDVTCADAVERMLDQCRPSVVINCASLANVDLCEINAVEAMRVNAEGAKNVATACDKYNLKLVHISSDYVFDGEKRTPYTETDSVNPLNVYGRTKQLSEQYALQFCSRVFVIRTAWLYGYAGNNFVKTILGLARQSKPIKVVNDQVGNPTNAADLTDRILSLIKTENYGLYHCTNSGECSWYEFACRFLLLSGYEYSIEPCGTNDYPRKARRPAYSSLNNEKLNSVLTKEMRLWQDAVDDFMGHYNKLTGGFNV